MDEIENEIIEWDNSYSVGIERLDNQHKYLFSLLNSLLENDDRLNQTRILQELLEYTREHFLLEEQLFDQYGFNGAGPHSVEHAYFNKKISDFKRDFDTNNARITDALVSFLKGWVSHHIKVIDQQYCLFFKSINVKID